MVDSTGTHGYQYDDVYRLTQASYPGGPIDNYTYDPNGNWQTKNGANYTYNAADQMVTDKDGVSYGYDNNGNQTSRGNDTFTYDHENRLTKIVFGGYEPSPDCYDIAPEPYTDGSVTGADISVIAGKIGTAEGFYGDIAPQPNPDGVVTGADLSAVSGQSGKVCPSRFVYNGDGLRVAHTGAYLNWRYVWDVAAGLPVILKENDSHNQRDGHSTDNTYVYGLDLISVTDRVGAQSYYLYDGLGSVTGVTDGSGNSSAVFTYDVFGEIRSGAGVESEFRFTGEQRDSQSGRNFYYLRARYYDPASGRFLSQDPAMAGHPYAYADNSPVNLIDPSGMASEGGRFSSCQTLVAVPAPAVCSSASLYLVCPRSSTSNCFLVAQLPTTLPCANIAPGQGALTCSIGCAGQNCGGYEVCLSLNCISNALKVLDVLPLQLVSPKVAIAIDVSAGVVTEIQIITSDCDLGQQVELSIANAANLYFGVGSAPQGIYIETTTYLYINGSLATC